MAEGFWGVNARACGERTRRAGVYGSVAIGLGGGSAIPITVADGVVVRARPGGEACRGGNAGSA